MRNPRIILVLLICIGIATAAYFMLPSGSNYDEYNQLIDAKGIQFGMKPDTVFQLLGDKPEEEMCVYGYEFFFEDAGLNIGFMLDSDTVRRVTVRNTTDSLLGIYVGDSVDTAFESATQNGFTDDPSIQGRMKKEDVYFTAVSKDGKIIDQLILEIINDKVIN